MFAMKFSEFTIYLWSYLNITWQPVLYSSHSQLPDRILHVSVNLTFLTLALWKWLSTFNAVWKLLKRYYFLTTLIFLFHWEKHAVSEAAVYPQYLEYSRILIYSVLFNSSLVSINLFFIYKENNTNSYQWVGFSDYLHAAKEENPL